MSRVAVLAGMSLTLVLVGCGQTTGGPSDSATTTAVGTTHPQTPTAAPPAVDTSTATPTDSIGEQASGTAGPTGEETEQGEVADAAYPQDPEAYLDDLIAAWAAEDADRVAALTAPEAEAQVEAGISTWAIPAEGWTLACNHPPPCQPGYSNAVDAGGIMREHPTGMFIEASVDPRSLGREGAVSSLELTVDDPGMRRTDSRVNAYVDTVHTAIVEQDVATLQRYATPEVVTAAARYSPETHGSRITDLGFYAGGDGRLVMFFDYPDKQPDDRPEADPFHMEPRLLVLDLGVVLDGGDHGVVQMGAWLAGP